MSTPKFTPGPWKAPTEGKHRGGVEASDGELVCDPSGSGRIEYMANARLIAKVPVMYLMLAQLEAMLRHLPEHGIGHRHDQVWPETLVGEADNIRKLLAKIDGGDNDET